MNDEPLFRTITRLRKEGNLEEAWNLGSVEVQKNQNDNYIKGSFFWVCYEYLKIYENDIKKRAENTNHNNLKPNGNDLAKINNLIDWVVWLDIPDGGFEYRSLLLVFQSNLEWFPKLVQLLFKHKDTFFQPEDYQPYIGEKGESPSLMLKFARKVAAAWIESKDNHIIDTDEIVDFFSTVRTKAKDTQHIIWLDYDEAKILILENRMTDARDFVIPVLRKKQTESWAWGALATTYRNEDIDVAIKLYSQGLSQIKDEKFALRLLRGIAPLLAHKGLNKEASMCVKRAISVYHQNGWAIKNTLEQLTHTAWYIDVDDFSDLNDFFLKSAEGALDYLYTDTRECTGIVEYIHQKKRGFNVYCNKDLHYPVKLSVTLNRKIPKPGSYIQLTLSNEDDSVIAAKPCESIDLEDVEAIEGRISVKEKGFGFVDNTFVPPPLIKEGMDGQFVKGIRIKSFDKKKNHYSWKALTIDVI